MITKFNTKTINPKWGGVICLTLGANKPDNFNEIVELLKKITNDKEHYIISIYDIVRGIYLGDCEIVRYDEGRFHIIQSYINPDLTGYLLVYKFYEDNSYIRTEILFRIFSNGEYTSLHNRLTELETKINELENK